MSHRERMNDFLRFVEGFSESNFKPSPNHPPHWILKSLSLKLDGHDGDLNFQRTFRDQEIFYIFRSEAFFA